MSVTYEAVLDVSEDSVVFLSGLLHAERVRRGTLWGANRRFGWFSGSTAVVRFGRAWLLMPGKALVGNTFVGWWGCCRRNPVIADQSGRAQPDGLRPVGHVFSRGEGFRRRAGTRG
jgi:hypothetical protein